MKHGHRSLRMSKRGLTGIETAIILIAFVISASVFAFAVLNKGMVTTQQSQEVVSTGLKQASSALQVQGHIIAHGDPANETIWGLRMYVNLAPGQEPIDFNQTKLVISYQNDRVHVPDIFTGLNTSTTPIILKNVDLAEKIFLNTSSTDTVIVSGKQYQVPECMVVIIQNDSDTLLEGGETFLILIRLDVIDARWFNSALSARLKPYDTFSIEIKPQIGATLSIIRSIPPSIAAVMDLG